MAIRYIVCGVLLTISVGAMFGSLFTLTFFENAHVVIKWLIGSIIAVVIGFGIILGVAYNHTQEKKLWNNGYCIECGSPYRFTNADYNNKTSQTTYYYSCDSCGKVIALGSQYDKISK